MPPIRQRRFTSSFFIPHMPLPALIESPIEGWGKAFDQLVELCTKEAV